MSQKSNRPKRKRFNRGLPLLDPRKSYVDALRIKYNDCVDTVRFHLKQEGKIA
jgi:hypothetical protein